jgi:hypothetical protein
VAVHVCGSLFDETLQVGLVTVTVRLGYCLIACALVFLVVTAYTSTIMIYQFQQVVFQSLAYATSLRMLMLLLHSMH